MVAGYVGHGERVQAGGASGGQVEPAADALAGAATTAGRAAGRCVVGNRAAVDLQARLAVVVEAAAEAVAAVGARAAASAGGRIAAERAARDGESGRLQVRERAPQPIRPGAAAPSDTAEGLI